MTKRWSKPPELTSLLTCKSARTKMTRTLTRTKLLDRDYSGSPSSGATFRKGLKEIVWRRDPNCISYTPPPHKFQYKMPPIPNLVILQSSSSLMMLIIFATPQNRNVKFLLALKCLGFFMRAPGVASLIILKCNLGTSQYSSTSRPRTILDEFLHSLSPLLQL